MKRKLLAFGICFMIFATAILPCANVFAAENYTDNGLAAAQSGVFEASGTKAFVNNCKTRSNQNIELVKDTTANTLTLSTIANTTSGATEWRLNGAWSRSTDWTAVWSGFDFSLNTNYIVSGIKYRNISETDVTPYFGVELMAYRSNGGRFSATKVHPVTATGDNWQEYSEVLNIGDLADFANFHLTVGLTRGDTALTDSNGNTIPAKVEGAKVLVDTTNMYFAKEVAMVENVLLGSATVISGESTTARAQVVNQLGQKSSFDQTLSFITLDETRQNVINDIEIVPANDNSGNYTINVGSSVPSGKYIILARSAKYHEDTASVQKGIEITVVKNDNVDTVKTEASDDYFSGLFKGFHSVATDSTLGTGSITVESEGSWLSSTKYKTYTATSTSYTGAQGYILNGSVVNLISDLDVTLQAGEKYQLSGLKLQNQSSDGIIPYFGFEILTQFLASDGKAYDQDHVYNLQPVTATGDNWQEYTGIVTIEKPPSGDNAVATMIVGMPHSATKNSLAPNAPTKVVGGVVKVDTSNVSLIRLGSTHEISNEAVGSTTTYRGSSLTFETQVKKLDGTTTGVDQTIDVTVLDSTRRNKAEGFTVSSVENGRYTVTVGEDVADGTYVVLASNATNATTGILNKGVTITVSGDAPVYETEITRDGYGVKISALESITNGQLIFATYDEFNKMIGFKVVDITLAAGESKEIALPVGIKAGSVTRVLLWKDFETFAPLADSMRYYN